MLVCCQQDGPQIISPDMKNIKVLKSILIPQTQKELWQFLGLANALAKFSLEHQRQAKVLYGLINSFARLKSWTLQHTSIFNEIKQYLCDPEMVVYPFDPELPVCLFTNASQVYGPGFSTIIYNEL